MEISKECPCLNALESGSHFNEVAGIRPTSAKCVKRLC